MTVSVRSGTPTTCMAMPLPEQRECVLTSSGEDPSLDSLALMVSSQRTEMMFESLT